MARCDQGYLCQVCGEEVEGITDSALYLHYVLGEVDPEKLHALPERHLRCEPSLAQFIVADDFAPISASGPFAKADLDGAFVAEEEARVTAAYSRLKELASLAEPVAITDYPLPEAAAKWRDAPR